MVKRETLHSKAYKQKCYATAMQPATQHSATASLFVIGQFTENRMPYYTIFHVYHYITGV